LLSYMPGLSVPWTPSSIRSPRFPYTTLFRSRPVTEPLYLDLHFSGPTSFRQALPATHNAFVYVYRGNVLIGNTEIMAGHMAILANRPTADGVVIKGDQDSRALLIAGRPLNERIVQYGPFVMNSEEEIHQALRDYHAGHFAGTISNVQP